jgi:hypothetical protein
MKREWIAAAVLVAIVAAAHGAVLSQWWLWDDPQLLHGAMRFGALDHFFSPMAWQQQSAANFVPMLLLTTEIDLKLFGVDPRGFYLHHLGVLTAAVLALYAYLRTFTTPVISATAAAAFALSQPAFTVATLLMDRHYAAGLLVSIVAMHLFRRNHPVAGAALYFVACLEKEVYVPLPLLIVVQALVTKRDWRIALRDGALCVVAASAYLAWRIYMLRSFGGYGGGDASLSRIVAKGWMAVTGTREIAAVLVLVLLAALAALTARRAPWQTTLIIVSAAIVILVPIAGLVSLDSRFFFMAAAVIVTLAAIAAKGRTETMIFVAFCAALAIGGVFHGVRLRRDLASWQRDGQYVWNAPAGANPLFTSANGWYIEGIQWLRRTVKQDEPPRIISSIPGFVIAGITGPEPVRREYEIVRAHAVPDMPLSVELTLRRSELHWSLGPVAKGDSFFFVTPNYELIWTRTPTGWVRLPADVRVPTATDDRNRLIRVMRRSGDHWTVSRELPLPVEGATVRWQRPATN